MATDCWKSEDSLIRCFQGERPPAGLSGLSGLGTLGGSLGGTESAQERCFKPCLHSFTCALRPCRSNGGVVTLKISCSKARLALAKLLHLIRASLTRRKSGRPGKVAMAPWPHSLILSDSPLKTCL